MSTYSIVYTPPGIEDEVVVSYFYSLADAEERMEQIKLTNLKAYAYHRIVITEDEWLWVDSGIEQGI